MNLKLIKFLRFNYKLKSINLIDRFSYKETCKKFGKLFRDRPERLHNYNFNLFDVQTYN